MRRTTPFLTPSLPQKLLPISCTFGTLLTPVLPLSAGCSALLKTCNELGGLGLSIAVHYLIFLHQFSIFPFYSAPGNVGHFV